MNTAIRNILGKIIVDLGNRITKGEFELEEEEMLELAQFFTHKKINLEETCRLCGFSRATLFRKIDSKELPKPHKDLGGKLYYWRDEIETLLNKLKSKKSDK